MTSRTYFDRALATAPGGVHSPVRAFHSVGGTPVFFLAGDGAKLTDVSGITYIDFCLSFGPLILGHRDAAVLDKLRAALDDGWSFGACEPYSLDLAEWIITRLPWVERIRFVSSGTEAVMSVLRIARAATGRSRVLKFEGCYHGHSDAMLVRAGSGLALSESKGEWNVAASSDGVPDGILGDTLVAPLDDDDALRRMFEQNGRAIAAAIVEPLPANFGLLPQREEWLRTLAALCREHGALLILDEVISGFRVGRGGMAEALSIVPDLVCYGKVIGGGFPVAAYAGRADLMSLVAPDGPVYQAGTLSANPVGMRAGLATLARMEAENGWRTLTELTSSFARQLADDLAACRARVEVVHAASIFWLRRAARLRQGSGAVRSVAAIPQGQGEWYQRFFHAALDRGVYLPPSGFEVCFVSLAHERPILDEARAALVEAAREAEAIINDQ